MIKLRYLFSFILLSVGILGMQAQLPVGSWRQFASFATVDKLIDTDSKVYFLTCGQLYSYDKDNDETYCYSSGNRLSDSNITDIYYNAVKKQLVVVYSNSNIDVIDRDDRVYNMPDIKDASLDMVPVINDIAFDGDRFFAVTNFGIVAFDIKKMEVISAGNYRMNLTNVMVSGDNIWVREVSNFHHIIDKNVNLTSISNMKKYMLTYTTDEMCDLGDDLAVFIAEGRKQLSVKKLVPRPGRTEDMSFTNDTNLRGLTKLADGSVMCHSNTRLYTITPDGTVSSVSLSGTPLETKSESNTFETKTIGSYKGLDRLWMGNRDGLSSYSLKDGQLTVLSEPIHHADGLTFVNVGNLVKDADGAIYAASLGYNRYLEKCMYIGPNTFYDLFYINKLSDGVVTDLSPVKYTPKNKNQRPYSTDPVGFKSGLYLHIDPNDTEGYVVGSVYDGFYYFKNGEEVAHYYEDNSTLQTINYGYCVRSTGLEFDRHGNLWLVQLLGEDDVTAQFHMLPADKVGTETTKADWQLLNFNRESGQNGVLLACENSNNILYIDGSYKTPITVIKTKGTTTLSDDEAFDSQLLVDQDGIAFSYEYMLCMVEDQNGHVWVGTDNGVIEITNPDAITNSTFTINHLKVPRNDGTNFADYLLDGEIVTSIAVDPANRKWITTVRSGVYLVSENGDKILEHFDPTNSPLSTYGVLSAICDDRNNVYFATTNGLYQYSGTASHAAQDYSQVYAYPNPVRPEYTGWITITGLMDNSLVKIADAAGNVFYQGTSEGGMLVWDGCDAHGRRVKTGVYYVFASIGGTDVESNGAVTKILVVN